MATNEYNYNDFAKSVIKTTSGAGSDNGWHNDEYTTDNDTPLDTQNLNAMLDMLIQIRNFIGKSSDFTQTVNKTTNISSPTAASEAPYDSDNTLGKYLEKIIAAIVGNKVTDSNTTDTNLNSQTLTGLRAYLESLDVTSGSTYEDSSWIKTLSQSDGEIAYTIKQPKDTDIINNVEIRGTHSTPTNSKPEILKDALQTETTNRALDITSLWEYINNLDFSNSPTTDQWAKSVTQTDGKIAVTYTQPSTDNIVVVGSTTDNLSSRITDWKANAAKDGWEYESIPILNQDRKKETSKISPNDGIVIYSKTIVGASKPDSIVHTKASVSGNFFHDGYEHTYELTPEGINCEKYNGNNTDIIIKVDSEAITYNKKGSEIKLWYPDTGNSAEIICTKTELNDAIAQIEQGQTIPDSFIESLFKEE